MRKVNVWTVFTAVLWIATVAGSVQAIEQREFSMDVLIDGRPLREYPARGRTYIEAHPQAEYSVRLRNHGADRVAVALSVDGLNSIDAKHTSAREASKWILGPYETIVIDGWQTSSDTARRFFFTTEERSYGAWLGATTDLGGISAAFFKEKQPRPAPFSRSDQKRRMESKAPDAGRAQDEGQALEEGDASAPLSDDLAATGIGRRLDHRVQRVRFVAQDRPAALLSLRYEYRDALIRLGVLPRVDDPLARRERSRGFEDQGFAPDPYGPPCCD